MSNRTGRRGVAIGAPGQPGGDDNREHAPAAIRRGVGSSLPPAASDPPAGAGALPLRLPAALAVLASLLLIATTPWLGMVQSVLVLPWFVPTVTALVCLTLGALAFLGYLRYATTRLFYPIAFALTCWAEMLFNFGFLLSWPGLVGSGGVIGDTPSASAYMFLFGLLVLPLGLGTAHLVPALTVVTISRWFVRIAVIATTILCGLLIAVVAAWDEHLPSLVGGNGAYSAILVVGNSVGAIASVAAAALAWRRYRRGTIFLTGIATLLLVGQWATIAVLLGLSRYTLPFYGFHLLRATIWAVALFALLGEYIQLYRAQARLLAFERARRDRLYEVARALAATRDVERIAAQIVEATCDLLGATAAALYRYEPTTGHYVLQAAGHLAAANPSTPAWPVLAAIPPGAIDKDGVLALPDASELPATALPRTGPSPVRALLAAQLPGQPTPLGVLEAYFTLPRTFAAGEREMLRVLADTAAPALENAQLFAELQISQQRAQAAAALADARRVELETVLQALPEGIVFVNRQTGEVRCNPAAAELLEAAPVEIGVRPSPERAHRVLRPSGEVYPPDELPLTRALERGEALVGEELVFLTAAGERRHLLTSAAPLHAANGEHVGAVALFQDITSIKELEHERDRFLSLVVHELRNPLAAIKGLAQVIERRLRQGMEVEPDRLDLITKQVDELHRLTADLSRLQAGQFDLTPVRFDLSILVREVVEQQRAASPGYSVELDLPAAPLWVQADPQRIEQILINLLGNAVKYSPEADRLEVRVARDGRVRVSVRDFGIGVPAESRPLLFQRFQRAANARRKPGLGLGLYISQRLAQASGGAVGYEPADPGSVFWLDLPLVAAPPPARQKAAPPATHA
jgi:PAS domain S-box-containing protein